MIRKSSFLRSPMFALLLPAIVLGSGSALADGDGQSAGAIRLLTTVPIPGASPMKTFDISWVDSQTELYFLADRTNKAIDVIDSRRNVVVDQITGGFAGATGNNDTSGPNGVTSSGHWLFVTDALRAVVAESDGTNKAQA